MFSLTLEEDKKILDLVDKFGPKFKKIVKFLPKFTFNTLKNRYYKKLRFERKQIHSTLQKIEIEKSLNTIKTFTRQLDEIQKHIDHLKKAIFTKCSLNL